MGAANAVRSDANAGRFRYTGQQWFTELGMYYYKARIYYPALGRFLQTDPVGYGDQINLYTYVGNDPVNHSDPTGMQDRLDIQMRQDDEALLSGKMSEKEYRDRQNARGEGGLIGLAVVGTAIATDGFGLPALVRFGGRLIGLEGSSVITSRAAIQTFSTQIEQAGFKSTGEVGKVIGWSGGRSATAQATARAGEITKDAVAGMREQGLTKPLANAARDVYRSAVSEGTGGATAEARLKLMDKILRNW